jgi:hypothetical protein
MLFALLAVIFGAIATLDHIIDDWSIPWALALAITFIAASLLLDPIINAIQPRRRG